MKSFLMICLMCYGMNTLAQDKIKFTAPEVYPEGVAYDPGRDVFYVSSVTTAAIGRVTRDGKYNVLFADSSLKSSFGMKYASGRIWVCTGDPSYSKFRDSATYKKMIRLIAIDAATGKKTRDVNLSSLYAGKHFANDLTVDDKGNIYITDSYSPVIYQVTADGNARVLAEHELFKAVGTGLNGIAWHSKGMLLVVNNANGALLRVPLDNPRNVTVVKTGQFFPGADGLWLDPSGQLYLAQNKGVNKIFKLTTSDNWQSAKVVAATAADAMFSFPSTLAARKEEVWVMNAKLHELTDSTTVPSKEFSLQRAVFLPVK